MKDDLEKYRPQIRRFLTLSGCDIAGDGTMKCISPDHADEHPSATCYETNVTCHVCGTSWDIYDACGLVKGMGTGRSTFRERVRIVKETLGDFGGADDRSNPNPGRELSPKPKGSAGPKNQREDAAPSFIPLSVEAAKEQYTPRRLREIALMSKGVTAKIGTDIVIAGSWMAKDEQGRIEVLAVRWERKVEDGRDTSAGGHTDKAVLSYWYDGRAVRTAGAPIRLFGRPGLADHPDWPVLIVEGEKCWQAAQAIPSWVPCTWNGGAKKAKLVDWSALAGRDICIYPDDDAPGTETAHFLAGVLKPIAKSVRVVVPLPQARAIKPQAADIVEALQVRSPEAMASYLRDGPELAGLPSGGTEKQVPDSSRSEGVGIQESPTPDGKVSEPDRFPFRILGTADDEQIYFITSAGLLRAYRASGLTKGQLITLAPLPWFQGEFAHKGKIQWDDAIDFIVRAAEGVSFNADAIRGRGAWVEQAGNNGTAAVRYVYHDGEVTYGSDVSVPFSGDPCRIYVRKTRMDMGLEMAVATRETRGHMFQAASEMSFETQADCARLLAWSVLAPFCGALPWRPAGFVTGESGTGKSTILQMIVKALAHPLYVSGSSTEAGIRQTVGNDCLGVEIDELESADENEHRNAKNIFGVVRQSTSDDAPPILKGTTTGKAQSYATHCMYLFSAISPGLEKQADLNRFFIVDLKRPENDWPTVRAAIEKYFTPDNCAGVRAFVWPRIPQIIATARAMVDAIREASGVDTRYALLEGILWAAHWIVWKDRVPAAEELREWLAVAYKVKAPVQIDGDAEEWLSRLLTEVVPVFDAPAKRYPLEHMARALATGQERPPETGAVAAVPLEPQDEERYRHTLSQFGLYVNREGELCVAVKRQQIAKILGTSSQYSRVLSRHPLCVDKSRVVKPTGEISRRCMVFSPGVLEGEPPI